MQIATIALSTHGGPEVLEARSVELPERPPAGMVRVRPIAVALNHLDLWVRRGLPSLKLTYPHRLGSDIAGTLEAIGDGVAAAQLPKLGERVLVAPGVSCGACEACLSGRDNLCRGYHILGESVNGGLAELLDVPAANLLPYPAGLSFAEAAAVPLTFQTAWQMVVDKAAVRPGDTLLVMAASSGVSVAAIQIAKLHGARVIAVTSSAAKAERARSLGADEVIDTSVAGAAGDFVGEAKRLTGKRGVDAVIEHVGGETFAKCILATRNGGAVVTCGATSGPSPQIDLRHVFFRQIRVLGSTMGSKAVLHAIVRHVERRALRPIVDRVLPFDVEGVRAAHRALEERAAFGKVVVSREG
jgi:NADPH:quinone reductase-like Zn-dependent oxidoreductase